MVITVTVPDAFATEAEARGLTPERYIEEMLAGVRTVPELSQPEKTKEQRRADLERFFEEMAAFSDKIPILPDEALTRESFYSDHD
jgi:hypothetical protein